MSIVPLANCQRCGAALWNGWEDDDRLCDACWLAVYYVDDDFAEDDGDD